MIRSPVSHAARRHVKRGADTSRNHCEQDLRGGVADHQCVHISAINVFYVLDVHSTPSSNILVERQVPYVYATFLGTDLCHLAYPCMIVYREAPLMKCAYTLAGDWPP